MIYRESQINAEFYDAVDQIGTVSFLGHKTNVERVASNSKKPETGIMATAAKI